MEKPKTLPSGAVLGEVYRAKPGYNLWKVNGVTQFCDYPNCAKEMKHTCDADREKYLGPRPWPWELAPVAERYSCWDILAAVAPFSTNILLYGPPSTGKTYAGLYMALDEETEVIAVTVTEEMPNAELRGVWTPRGSEGLVWMDGPVTRGVRAKGPVRIVINELDKASSDVFTFLYPICEGESTLRVVLPNNEEVRLEPGKQLSIWATMNGDPQRDLPEALATRFPVKIHVDRVNPAALKELPAQWREAAERMCLIPEPERRTYLREWLAFSSLIAKLPADIAARAVFGARSREVLVAAKLLKAK